MQAKKLLCNSNLRDVMSPDLDGAYSPLLQPCTEKLDLSTSDSENDGKPKQASKFGMKEIKETSYNNKTGNRNFNTIQEKPRSTVVISDSSDEDFENFLIALKTPKQVAKKGKTNGSIKDFIIDSDEDEFDSVFSKNKTGSRGMNGLPNSTVKMPPAADRDMVSPQAFVSPVFISDSDDDDSIVIKSTWHTRIKEKKDAKLVNGSKPKTAKEKPSQDTTIRGLERREQEVNFYTSESSDEEFESLVERIKKRTKDQTPSSTASKSIRPQASLTEPTKVPCLDLTNRKENGSGRKPKSLSKMPPSPHFSSDRILKEVPDACERPRSDSVKLPCKVPDCFLQDLSYPNSVYVKNFKQKKEALTSRLYSLYNQTIFDQKLPETMEIIWNKKMRKTAGYCVTGQKRLPELQRYARIELSEKVCDSADRLRDTLIHEICHAATWLINGVRDGHGQFWRFYAKKATVVHPELPMVTRCHTYEINYKYTYECSRCKNTIGRHSKSLDTERFVCALCKGKLVLLSSTRKDGSPAGGQLTPFAKYVKENYGSTKKGMTGMSHAEVMRKLSADFSSKTKISS
ncbi:acidic repeat-containing protein isoform X2 [Xenopus laevis]|uniref:Acidic repeat-containing protein isoform X2 n=1 Tax=Xenopus laevis TaxID=8355 RepID=A0A8J0TJV9_XENLA|nr:acidic repeat-containing protein isoform X2 [Xenopus laevis]